MPSPTRPADPAALLSARLRTQHLSGTPLPTPARVVGHLACVQAQDPFGANWSLAMRARGATEASILAAYDRGEFLRTHVLRPTWHYVLPADIGWILALTSPNVLRLNRGQERELELGPAVYRRTHTLIARALEGGNHLTREGLSEVLLRGKVKATGRRLAYVVMEAELTGLVCSGAMQGKQHTYALLEERAPRGRKLGREEGVAELLRRFVEGHAPTTVRHFSWWSGIGLTEARRARAALGKTLSGRELDGVEWLGARTRSTKRHQPGALLVPEYDEVLVGTADIGIPRLMADRRSTKGPGKNTFDRPILVGGAWVGTWRRVFEGKGIALEAELFARPTGKLRALLADEGERYAKYSGARVVVRVTSR